MIELLDLFIDSKLPRLNIGPTKVCAKNLNSELELCRRVSLNLGIKLLQSIKFYLNSQPQSKKQTMKVMIQNYDSSANDFLKRTASTLEVNNGQSMYYYIPCTHLN